MSDRGAKQRSPPLTLASVQIVAAVLMVSLVWMWWQTDKADTIDKVVSCLESEWVSEAQLSPAQLARSCYENLGADEYDYGYDF